MDPFTELHAMISISNSSFLDIPNNTLKCIKKRDCFLLGYFNCNILDCEKPQISDFVDEMFNNTGQQKKIFLLVPQILELFWSIFGALIPKMTAVFSHQL